MQYLGSARAGIPPGSTTATRSPTRWPAAWVSRCCSSATTSLRPTCSSP